MSHQIPQPGTYQGKVNGAVVVYEAKSGALCAAIPVILLNSDVAWHGKHTMTLIKKDGEVQGRTLQTLKEVFGWDGLDPFWLTEQDFSEITFDLVCQHEEFTPEPTEENPDPQPVPAFKIQWMNAPGGGSRMPEMADRKSILAKYGNKFKALSGGKPSPAPAKAAAAAPEKKAAAAPPTKAPAKASGPPTKTKTAGGQPPTATVEEAWAACQKANPEMSDEQAGEVYYAKIGEMFPGVDPGDLTIQQCGALKVAFES